MRLIDADVLIEKFNEKCDMATALVDEKTAERFHTFCVLADAVEDAPTIDAVLVRHGHWITHNPNNPFEIYGECSECGFEQSLGSKLIFCPNCGAKMDAEVKDDTNTEN